MRPMVQSIAIITLIMRIMEVVGEGKVLTNRVEVFGLLLLGVADLLLLDPRHLPTK